MPGHLDSIDLSHLTPEERKHILGVMKREKDENDKEEKMIRDFLNGFQDYKCEVEANARKSANGVNGSENTESVCSLCSKTKFVEGGGHICSLCQRRFCSRCGGKITVKSNKTAWICKLCRTEKELLAKTGRWFHGSGMLQWDSKSLSGSEKENASNSINNHVGKNPRSTSSSRGAIEKSDSVVFQFQRNAKASRTNSMNDIDGKSHRSSPRVEDASNLISKDFYSKIENCTNDIDMKSSSTSSHTLVSSTHTARNSSTKSDTGNALRVKPTSEQSSPVSPHNLGFCNDHSPNHSMESTGVKPSQDQRAPERRYHDAFDLKNQMGCAMSITDTQSYNSELRSHNTPANSSHKPSSAIISHSTRLNLRDLSKTGSLTSFEETQSTDCSSECISDSDFTSSKRSALQEQSNYRMRRRRERQSSSGASAVNSEDHSHRYNQPFWKLSADGHFKIAHVNLDKNMAKMKGSHSSLGFKVVGGKTTVPGRLGAFISIVKEGSLADTVGRLQVGDEIISWNEHCLQNASYDEIHHIIASSRDDPKIRLVVARPVSFPPRTRLPQGAESSTCSLDSDRRDRDSPSSKSSLGMIQMKLGYDERINELFVTAIRAMDLPPRGNGLSRSTYVKMYLLPDRNPETKRKTKITRKSLSPEWMQKFAYSDITPERLGQLSLEVAVWDVDRTRDENSQFIGEIIINLGFVCLDDEPHWFCLRPLGQGNNQNHPRNRSTSSTPITSCDAINMSVSSTPNNLSTHPPKSVTKRRLPALPKSFSRSKDGDTTDLSSLVDPGESVSRSLSHSQYGNSYEDPSSTSIHQTMEAFVGGIGPGQVLGRQALAMTPVGEIELVFKTERGKIVIQVGRAFDLPYKKTSKTLPAYYVKLYMMDGMKCVAKKKTKLSSRSISPIFNEALSFELHQKGNMLHVMVFAVNSRIDGKTVAGVAEILLEQLDTISQLSARYKLFPSATNDLIPWSSRHDSNSSLGSSSVLQS